MKLDGHTKFKIKLNSVCEILSLQIAKKKTQIKNTLFFLTVYQFHMSWNFIWLSNITFLYVRYFRNLCDSFPMFNIHCMFFPYINVQLHITHWKFSHVLPFRLEQTIHNFKDVVHGPWVLLNNNCTWDKLTVFHYTKRIMLLCHKVGCENSHFEQKFEAFTKMPQNWVPIHSFTTIQCEIPN